MVAVIPVLEEQNRLIVGRVDRLESYVRNTVTIIEKQVEVANMNLVNALRTAHNQQWMMTANFLSEVEQLNETIDTLKPLMNQVDMTVTELYERIKAGVTEMAKTCPRIGYRSVQTLLPRPGSDCWH
ncbi:uncharacterized protein BT62DRAFT_721657 [Guyanagaster necrorhizus]|uniref:Uncharacterized protein n=1 Tax=Guyanagaster necrorhizus TaxID=856835 RepID=A0A9P8AW85_9AGAR|nr:uncharacterized protein BT62DRAFT_721657 [Guyanagaster necrorhizus MCA 3950]KAG7448687.1 hypothetical protein BT62DRAFT_721657 [Guyanagaster necrorhizus MCA 3950]